jgi:hypothetical protein
MKTGLPALLIGALALTSAPATEARGFVSVVVNPFAFVAAPPPVIYQPAAFYVPPPVVYVGGGYWGGGRGGHPRGRGRNRRR